jgi:serine/threonine-protein kinase
MTRVLADRYVIEREIARGGMATVYVATDRRYDRTVAIKILHPELVSAIGPGRFSREIEVAAHLSHPHIVSLYDSGETEGSLFYVMPYIQGESLRQKIDREQQLSVDDAVEITRQIASALDYAHARQLVHRDVKPENILLHEGIPMVTDFGIALTRSASLDDRLTIVGHTLGTPHYMSPEQASGDVDLDARSDVYSLACVLFEMLTGSPPFTGPNAQAVIARRFTDTAPLIRRYRSNVPERIELAIRKALARNPADRYQTCGAFAEALARHVERESPLPSVAVLPFLNLSSDAENEFFADGITEDVIAQLSKIRSLKVISRASVMRYKRREPSLQEIAATLGVGTLLDGSVRRAGNQVRIVAQLVDVADDQPLWSETYDRKLTDIFAIQTDVALEIASALEAELSPAERRRIHREPTDSLQAYQAYLQGRFWYGRYTNDGIKKGLTYFNQAISVDPEYALAYVGIGMAYAEMAVGQDVNEMRPEESHRRAREAVETALKIDPELGEAHSMLGLLSFTHDFDWVRAEAEFKLALELSPGSADIYDHYGWLCGSMERWDEALALVKRAEELDPLMHRSDVASTLVRAGRYEEALESAKHAVSFDPQHGRSNSTLGWALIKLGRVDEGLASLERAVAANPDSTMYLAQLGQAYAITGDTTRAREALRVLEERATQRYVSPYHLAYVYTGLGDAEGAIDLLERAFDERAGSVYGIKGSFLFAPLRSHPRFQALLAKINLA